MTRKSIAAAIALCAWATLAGFAAQAQTGHDFSEDSAHYVAPKPSGKPHMVDSDKWYPPLSESLGEEGTTVLSFTITTKGTITDISVARSSGYPRLDNAAMDAVKNWTYTPARKDGKPIAVPWHTSVAWRLRYDDDDLEALAAKSTAMMLTMTAADFPPGARNKGEYGVVLLSVTIEATGSVGETGAYRSSGYPDLDRAAIDYMRHYRFEPPKIDGTPVTGGVMILVKWPEQANAKDGDTAKK